MTVNRMDFIQQLVDKHGYTKKAATALVADFLDMVVENIENGNEIAFSGFGRFSIIERKGRRTKNPKTKEWMEVPAHLVPRFHPGNRLKFAVRHYGSSRNVDVI